MKTADGIAWFKRTFGERIAAGLAGTPFSVDLVAAIANQETGYIWGPLVERACRKRKSCGCASGDTLDADRGRSSFPRNRGGAARGAPRRGDVRDCAPGVARHGDAINGYQAATMNPNKFCHGYGIFQYRHSIFQREPGIIFS